MKKHIFSLFMGYILLFYPFIGIACASDGYENTLDSLFSSANRTVEPVFNDELIYSPNTYNYNLDPIDFDIWQTEVPFAPEAFSAFDATENIPILELNFSHEITGDKAQAAPLAPTKWPARDLTCTVTGCIYATAIKSNLTRHMLTHTGEKSFKCTAPNCNYAAVRRSTLTSHMLTHTEERPYKCTAADCNYAAVQQSTLTRHMFVHTGEKPHKCPEPDCDYATTTKSDLARHMFVHTGEKPHKCPEPDCNYATADRSHLTRHMRNTHTKEHPAKRQRT